MLAFPSLRPGLRAALAFAFGGLALVNGALHVLHIDKHGASGGDFTGALAFAAGIVLLGLAAAIPFRHRGSGAHPWRGRAVAVPAVLVAVVFVLGPIGMGIVGSHKWRSPIGDPPSAAYREVGFEASDGLDLEGWYRPSENGANVLLVHGGSSDRDGSVAHAEMLAAHGYGVLLYDARGRGESDGSENNYGWDWAKDIDGALAFLKAQDGVDPDRIGALGLSTGADVLIEVAAERDDIAALVSDGAAAGSFADWDRLRGKELGTRARLRHVLDDPRADRRPARPGARGCDRARRVADAADLGRHRRGARVQRALRRGRRRRARRALEPARRRPHRCDLRAARGRTSGAWSRSSTRSSGASRRRAGCARRRAPTAHPASSR